MLKVRKTFAFAIMMKLNFLPLLHCSEGCLIKQVFVLDLIKVFVLDLNFLVNFNEDFIKVFISDLN